ncbi:unnamed protein product [Microthlaspi erraticum]|uniref:Arabidopsis retrotransposon Orf1 C-terminal domain-containing protein n=1 Tax=Microthlaspi erraticum TaxID=1685480 RepID=A0A6D2KT74_9BRAS|nr:unnamed protein product [Microthlaspi erraticum]
MFVGHEDDLREEEPELDRAEDQAQVDEDLDEPECYYFEEYEGPRMNPSVVAAHKRIGLLQKFNKWQGKAIKMQKSMDKMESIPPHHTKETPCPRTSQSLIFEPREEGASPQRRRKSSRARRSNSTSGLDRVQTEETQLGRADGRVDLEEPVFENPGFEYDPAPYQDYPQSRWNPYGQFERASSTKAK